MTKTKLAIAIGVVAGAMVYGIFVHRNHWPPYEFAKSVYSRIFPVEERSFDSSIDVRSLIAIHDDGDIQKLRKALIQFLWGSPVLPDSRPVVARGIVDPRFGVSATTRIDKLTLPMDFGLESISYHFVPRVSNGGLIVYHHGHDGGFELGKKHIFRLLEHGYSVVAFAMPLLGMNNQPSVRLPRHGTLTLTSHDMMKLLLPESGSPIKYFLMPVVAALNQLSSQYTTIAMVGISGGGWTTTLMAAIDPRISLSFPVAGSYPIYLRSNPRDWGDYEQTEPNLYGTVNYLEMYVLGSFGAGRKQIQVINRFDSCCFSGMGWQSYRDTVRRLGNFDVFVDSSHRQHKISKAAMERILLELGQPHQPISRRSGRAAHPRAAMRPLRPSRPG